MNEYTVKIEGFILGTWRAKGATVRLTPKQATQFLREGRVVEAKAEEKPTKAAKGKA